MAPPRTYNSFRPTHLHYANSYGWAGSQNYNSADIPGWNTSRGRDRRVIEQRTAYEWLDSASKYSTFSNPPFHSGAAGRLLPSLQDKGHRILRGFIRRAEYDNADRITKMRLYFMYNPEVIIRDYVSYLDQGALDPFNTVFDSKNLIAPPSFMDFSFELFFDRQAEAQARDNPGVFVDYEFFDMVVRNVIPSVFQNASALPDNGVMMVNPRDITVVFSPNITVQGRPLNARIAFERFTHRMVPTRMRISLTMRVIYIGPMRDMVEYTAEELGAAEKIPYGEIKAPEYHFTYEKMRAGEGSDDEGGQDDTQLPIDATNKDIREKCLEFAKQQVAANGTQYSLEQRMQLWDYADCSSLIEGAYSHYGFLEEMHWGAWEGTSGMISNLENANFDTADVLWKVGADQPGAAANAHKLLKGDLIFEYNTGGARGHVAFVESYDAASETVYVFHAANSDDGVLAGDYNIHSSYFEGRYNVGLRPLPAGKNAVTNQGGQQTRRGGPV